MRHRSLKISAPYNILTVKIILNEEKTESISAEILTKTRWSAILTYSIVLQL